MKVHAFVHSLYDERSKDYYGGCGEGGVNFCVWNRVFLFFFLFFEKKRKAIENLKLMNFIKRGEEEEEMLCAGWLKRKNQEIIYL